MRESVKLLLEKHQLNFNPEAFKDHNNYFHYVYLTVNNKNDHYYIGKRSTQNASLKYRGSGKNLLKAIFEYGDFVFDTYKLKFLASAKKALEFESVLVDQEIVDDPYSYNIRIGGGSGGWNIYNELPHECPTKGMVAYHKPNEDSFIFLNPKIQDIPKGYIKGSGHSNIKDTIWITSSDGSTHRMISSENGIPKGYELGRQGTPWIEGLVWYTNFETGKQLRLPLDENPPEGFVQGRLDFIGTKWYHKGEDQVLVKPGETIPKGYKKGMRLSKMKDRIFCYNYSIDKLISISKNAKIPEGFVRGYGPSKEAYKLMSVVNTSKNGHKVDFRSVAEKLNKDIWNVKKDIKRYMSKLWLSHDLVLI